MNIEITDKAYDHIIDNLGAVYIYTNSIRGCCGGQQSVDMTPQIELGRPPSDFINDYEKTKYKEVEIYISKKINKEKLSGKKIILKTAFGIFNRLGFD
ncbi:MAG: CC/Se motif family (seleno)protein [Halanaerobiales bacterium]